jgi:WD40 repeat protein
MGTTSLAFDPTGKRLASGGFTGEVIIWAVPSGEKLILLKQKENARLPLSGLEIVKGLVWLNHERLLSVSSNGDIRLWDVSHKTIITSITTPSPITSLVQISDSNTIITGHKDGKVRAYLVPELTLKAEYNVRSPVLSVAYDKIGHQIAVSTKGREVNLLSSNLGHIKTLEESSKNALEIRFSPGGEQLAAGGWYTLMFWDLKTGHVRQLETEHWGAVISVDYSPDGQYLVSLGRVTDANIRLLNLNADTIERRLLAHELCGRVIRFSPNGRYIASGSDDESVRLYDLNESYP